MVIIDEPFKPAPGNTIGGWSWGWTPTAKSYGKSYHADPADVDYASIKTYTGGDFYQPYSIGYQKYTFKVMDCYWFGIKPAVYDTVTQVIDRWTKPKAGDLTWDDIDTTLGHSPMKFADVKNVKKYVYPTWKSTLPLKWWGTADQVVKSKWSLATGKTITTILSPSPPGPSDWAGQIPGVDQIIGVCPALRENLSCHDGCICGIDYSQSLMSTVIHLNDGHRWTRDQIADWIETLDDVPGWS